MKERTKHLPTTRLEMEQRGWDSCDIIIITGDAYIDHPAFGTAIIARLLEAEGYTVGLIAQPAWDSVEPFRALGKPRLAWMITGGSIDSMVAHYTSRGKPRSTDACSPGGKAGLRPDRAVLTYSSRARGAYKGVPVLLGGLEASLRRLSHYDFWSDRIRKSILLDSKADILIYGMAERPVREICRRLRDGTPIEAIRDVPGTVFRRKLKENNCESIAEVSLPDWNAVSARDAHANLPTEAGKLAFAQSTALRFANENPFKPIRLVEAYPNCDIVQNPPAIPLDVQELDAVYDLPYTRRAHPRYREQGTIPALQEVSFSITSSRGCFGGCTFCAITTHQGRIVQARSETSLLREAKQLTQDQQFKGYIHDVGGPTANFRIPSCSKQLRNGPCSHRECLYPEPCPLLEEDHGNYLDILKRMSELPGVKKVFIRSGIRYDYLLQTASPEVQKRFIHQLCREHVSGQLKVAPEHVSSQTLEIMGKPPVELFDQFSRLFNEENTRQNKQQYIIPYFISGHPGSTLKDAVELACYLKKTGFIPDQVQDFYPTPSTVATCIYFSGKDPRPGKLFSSVHVPKGREKHLQRALLHFHKRENHHLVREALISAGRPELIGNSPTCLIRTQRTGEKKRRR
ncbi:MAG: YgiQ family radical SAM protein [Spirochaetota bacterium]